MKKNSFYYLFSIFILLGFIFYSTNSFARYVKVAEEQQQEDTTAGSKGNKADAAIKQGEAIKKSLLKKFTTLLKFKSNARQKEKDRIMEIVNAMDITDTVRVDIDRLRQAMLDIASNDTFLYRELTNNLKTALDKQTESLQKTTLMAAGAAQTAQQAFNLISQKIANLPLPASNDTGAKPVKIQINSKEEQSSVSAVRSMMTPAAFTSSPSDTNRIELHKKAILHAFCDANSSPNYATTRFDLYDAFVFDGLIFNGQAGTTAGAVDKVLLSAAKAAGSKVYLSVAIAVGDLAFLKSDDAQRSFAQTCAGLLQDYGANGINFRFKGVTPLDQQLFNRVLAGIVSQMHNVEPAYQVCLSVPAYQQGLYRLQDIDNFITYYYIDFTALPSATQAAPLAPLTGFQTSNITTSLAYYLNLQIPAGKFIAALPYRGTIWTLYTVPKRRDDFNGYITYAQIRRRYNWPVQYDESMSAYMDTIYNGVITRRIWYDDEKTLAAKYDYIIQSGLGGAAISYLGNDANFGELTNTLLYKFFEIDTIPAAPDSTRHFSFWQRLKRRLVLYHYILNNPCELCFEDNDTTHGNTGNMRQYIEDLNIDSAVAVINEKILKENKKKDTADWKPLTTEFLYINNELSRLTLYISLGFLLLSGGVMALYINRMRTIGENWKYKKLTAYTLTALLIVLIYFMFAFLFTKDWIPVFTVSGDPNDIEKVTQDSVTHEYEVLDCMPDKDCVNIPLHTLILTILLGAILGLLLGKYLILPAFKKKDVP